MDGSTDREREPVPWGFRRRRSDREDLSGQLG